MIELAKICNLEELAEAIASSGLSIGQPQSVCIRFLDGPLLGQVFQAIQFYLFYNETTTELVYYDASNPTSLLPTAESSWEFVDHSLCESCGCAGTITVLAKRPEFTEDDSFLELSVSQTSRDYPPTFTINYEVENGSSAVGDLENPVNFNLSPKTTEDQEDVIVKIFYDPGDGVIRQQQAIISPILGTPEAWQINLPCSECEPAEIIALVITDDGNGGDQVQVQLSNVPAYRIEAILSNNINAETGEISYIGSSSATIDFAGDAGPGDLVDLTLTMNYKLGEFQVVGHEHSFLDIELGNDESRVITLPLPCP